MSFYDLLNDGVLLCSKLQYHHVQICYIAYPLQLFLHYSFPIYAGESLAYRMRCLILAAFISFRLVSLTLEILTCIPQMAHLATNRRTAALLN